MKTQLKKDTFSYFTSIPKSGNTEFVKKSNYIICCICFSTKIALINFYHIM